MTVAALIAVVMQGIPHVYVSHAMRLRRIDTMPASPYMEILKAKSQDEESLTRAKVKTTMQGQDA